MSGQLLIYGAYGYTGQLIVELAVRAGARPILAGRSEARLRPLAERYGLPMRCFGLEDRRAVLKGLKDIAVLLNCAGPFSRTALPFAEACPFSGTHYLDITGEIEVFENLAKLHETAGQAGVTLLPGVGFDVVPSDCLAAHLKRRLPDATQLVLALHGVDSPSHGTATTMVENLDRGGMIRRDGKLTPVPTAWHERAIDFGKGPMTTLTIGWGDVATAWRSTGIPNIEVFLAASPGMARMLRLTGRHPSFFGAAPVQWMLKRLVDLGPAGPDAETRARARSCFWGEARNDAGRTVTARLETPEAYALTAASAWDIARRALAGEARPGYQTPSLLFGPDYILTLPGTRRDDLD